MMFSFVSDVKVKKSKKHGLPPAKLAGDQKPKETKKVTGNETSKENQATNESTTSDSSK